MSAIHLDIDHLKIHSTINITTVLLIIACYLLQHMLGNRELTYVADNRFSVLMYIKQSENVHHH